MTTVLGFFHIGITVRSMEQALPFYRDALGLEIQFTRTLASPEHRALVGLPFTEVRVVFLELPGGGSVELLEYVGLERHSAAARPCDPGSGHLAVYVEDIEATVKAGIESGGSLRGDILELTGGPLAGMRVCYLVDPDGFPIELFQRPAAAQVS